MIARYAVALTWVLDRQRSTLFVAVLTLVLTGVLYVVHSEGLLPGAGYRRDPGDHAGAASRCRIEAMAERQQALAAQILKNPDVESLTSFIGVDGSNITLNSGRMLINLKPRDDRSNTASDVIRAVAAGRRAYSGRSLYMQPVQDLTIDSTVSPTQYQFMLTDPNIGEFTTWVPKLVDRLQAVAGTRRRRHRPAGQRPVGLHRNRPRHGLALRHHAGYRRQRALRRIRPAHHLDHLHAVEPVPRDSGGAAADAALHRVAERRSTCPPPLRRAARCRCRRSRSSSSRPAPLLVTHLGQFPATTVSFNLAPGASLGAAVKAIDQAEKDIGLPASFQTASRARRWRSRRRCRTNCS